MWQSKPKGNYNVVGSAIAAAVAAVLTRKVASRPAEILSEIACWVILLFLFKITAPNRPSRPPNSSLLVVDEGPDVGFVSSIFAVGIALASFCKAESGVLGFIVSNSLRQCMV